MLTIWVFQKRESTKALEESSGDYFAKRQET